MEPDLYDAVCMGIVDLGFQSVEFKGDKKELPKVMLMFEFPNETIEIDGEIKPRQLSKLYTLSLHEKSNLRKHLNSWRKKEFTEEELDGFDLRKLIGVQCRVDVKHDKVDDKTYANIDAIISADRTKHLPPPSKKIFFGIDDESTWGSFKDIPKFIQKYINASVDFQTKGISIDEDGTVRRAGSPTASPAGTSSRAADDYNPINDTEDEELPF
jgi:hypothetical protein